MPGNILLMFLLAQRFLKFQVKLFEFAYDSHSYSNISKAQVVKKNIDCILFQASFSSKQC